MYCSAVYLSSGTASAWNDGFVRTPAAELCATTTVTVDKTFSWTASTYCQSGISTSVSMQEQVYCKLCVYRWQVTPTIQYNAQKWKSKQKWGRSGNTYHVISMWGVHTGGGAQLQICVQWICEWAKKTQANNKIGGDLGMRLGHTYMLICPCRVSTGYSKWSLHLILQVSNHREK